MQWTRATWLAAAACLTIALGCGKGSGPQPMMKPSVGSTETPSGASAEPADEVAAAIAELPEAERSVALAQKYCPVAAMGDGAHDSLLGSMGMPFKVTLEGEDVYLCCEGCKDTAEKDPAATLAKVAELKTRAAGEK